MQINSWAHLSRMASDSFEFLSIGPVPNNEECTPCGEHEQDGLNEAIIYAQQLERMFPPVPGAKIIVIRNSHDFGMYYEAGVTYTPSRFVDEEGECVESISEAYAMRLESGCDHWDDVSKAALIEAEHHLHTGKLVHIKRTA